MAIISGDGLYHKFHEKRIEERKQSVTFSVLSQKSFFQQDGNPQKWLSFVIITKMIWTYRDLPLNSAVSKICMIRWVIKIIEEIRKSPLRKMVPCRSLPLDKILSCESNINGHIWVFVQRTASHQVVPKIDCEPKSGLTSVLILHVLKAQTGNLNIKSYSQWFFAQIICDFPLLKDWI